MVEKYLPTFFYFKVIYYIFSEGVTVKLMAKFSLTSFYTLIPSPPASLENMDDIDGKRRD